MFKNKKIVVILFFLIFCIIFLHKNYAKYVLKENVLLDVYIDKTPPTICLSDNNDEERYNKTSNDLIKKTTNQIINTLDNIKVEYNEYYYNPSNNDFSDGTAIRFENGKELSDEGYYKIVSIDSSKNTTEIILLIDKTPPNVTVKFYKKSEISLLNMIQENGGVV